MIENLIIGSGLSAHIVSCLLKEKTKILCPELIKTGFSKYKINKKFSFNKILSKKSYSVTSLNYNLKDNIFLHDRIIHGGNSNVWGGFIKADNLCLRQKNLLQKLKLKLTRLDYKITNCISNNNSFFQLLDSNGEIYSSQNYIKNYINGFATSFYKEKSYFKIKYYCLKTKKFLIIKSKKLILATGLIQLLEILFNSKLINFNSTFNLSEFDHLLRFSLNKKIKQTKNSVIKYNFFGCIKHYLAYQKKNSLISNLTKVVPIYLEQNFLDKKREISITFTDKNEVKINGDKLFGNSIHYHNLRINNTSINTYLKKFSKNLYVVSMPAVNQKMPGPISNDIIDHIFENFG